MSLPIRLDPIEGESLSGYMLRLSRTYGIPPGDIGRNIGFWPLAQEFDSRRSGYRLEPEQVESISSTTGLSHERIRRMTLEHLNGKVFNANPTREVARGIPSAIGRRITTWDTAYCPLCLEQHGTWFLDWHSRWTLICETHECELIETCPTCGKSPSALRRIGWPAERGEVEKDPTCCWWSIKRKLCRSDLKQAEVRPVSDEVLKTHRSLSSATNGNRHAKVAGTKVESVAFISDLMGLMYLVRLSETAADQQPPDKSVEASGQAHKIATSRNEKIRLLPRAMELANLKTESELVDEIRHIGDSAYKRANLRLPQMRIFPGHSEPFGEAMSKARETCCYANVSAFYGFDRNRHRRPADLDPAIEPRHVPQLFWGREFDTKVWPLFEGIDFTRWRGRRLCSALLLRMVKPLSWEEAALDLGFPPDRYGHKAMSQAMSEFTTRNLAGELVAAVKSVANEKAASGLVDFRLQEHMMSGWEGVDPMTYRYMQPKYKPVKQHSEHVSQRSFVSTMIWSDVTESDETLAPFWRARGPYQATLFRQKNMHRIGPRYERLLEIVRQNPASSIQFHRGMLIGDLIAENEIAHTFRRPELSQELVERTMIHVSHLTGVDIPSMTEKISANTRPAGATNARILAALVIHRLGGSQWEQINDVFGSISNPARNYLRRIQGTDLETPLGSLIGRVRDGRMDLPNPAGPEPHHERMIALAQSIRLAAERSAPDSLENQQRILASIKACEEHTDLTWHHLEVVHDIHRPETITHPFRGYKLNEGGTALLKMVLSEASQLRRKAGYANSDLRRGLTVAA